MNGNPESSAPPPKGHEFVFGAIAYSIPARMMPGLRRYVEQGIKPGDFLCAIIDNDLTRAVHFADNENLPNIPAYVDYLYNHFPPEAWGSAVKRAAWIARHKIDREAARPGGA